MLTAIVRVVLGVAIATTDIKDVIGAKGDLAAPMIHGRPAVAENHMLGGGAGGRCAWSSGKIGHNDFRMAVAFAGVIFEEAVILGKLRV